MMKEIKQLIIITAMFALAMPAVILAESPPMPPIIISGTVTMNGSVASSGTVSIEGGQIATPITSNISSDAGRYSIPAPYENNGEELTFRVNDKIATSQVVTSPVVNLDLSVTIPVSPPPAPPVSSGGSSSGGSSTPSPVSPLSAAAQVVDTNGDDKIDILDFNSLVINWGKTGSGNVADFDNNGTVDIFDFNLLMTYWTG